MDWSLKRKLAAVATVLAAAAFAGGAYAATLDSPAHARQAVLNDVARRLKVSPQQLTSVAGLRAAITADLRARLDRAVSRNELTSAQAQQILDDLWARLDAEMSGIRPGLTAPRPAVGPLAALAY